MRFGQSAMKRLVEALLLHSGPARIASRTHRARTIVLAYHNVVPDGGSADGDRSLHLPLARFRAHLDVIQRWCTVAAIDQVLAASKSDRARVIITFDDAYRGAVRLALPELRRRGLPATIFVPPAYVPDHTFWWDDVARLHPAAFPGAMRDRALIEWRGRDDVIRAQVSGANRSATSSADYLGCASLPELTDATSEDITVGSHTWSHPNLAAATADELLGELQRPLAWLREHLPGAAVPWLSYPYGLQSPAVRAAALRCDYAGAFLVDGGWLPRERLDPFALPRFNVPAGLSADGLALRLSGLLRP